jgi:hypothetical protein
MKLISREEYLSALSTLRELDAMKTVLKYKKQEFVDVSVFDDNVYKTNYLLGIKEHVQGFLNDVLNPLNEVVEDFDFDLE